MQQAVRNLDALDLEVSRKEVGVLITKQDRQRSKPAGVTLESLNLNTGYHGVLDKRERKVEELARKYKVEMTDFQKAELMAKMDEDDEFYPAVDATQALEQSLRESVAHWKDLNKQKLRDGEAATLALQEPPTLAPTKAQREFSGQRLLNQELAQETLPVI